LIGKQKNSNEEAMEKASVNRITCGPAALNSFSVNGVHMGAGKKQKQITREMFVLNAPPRRSYIYTTPTSPAPYQNGKRFSGAKMNFFLSNVELCYTARGSIEAGWIVF
jgi:hypothetical protein